jgi:glycolate oxidase iron-sulfur subunit
MQTSFTLAQLADPDVAESERILRTCVHCGFCTATCPTYVLLGDELDSPRGRIYLIKDMLENDRPATPEVVKHIDRCLSCLSCMTTCPSGVHYMHLVDHARIHVEETYRRPLPDRVLRALHGRVLPHNGRVRLALRAGRLAKPFVPVLEALGLTRLAAMLRLAPAVLPPARADQGQTVFAARGPVRGRVALMDGCVTPVIGPQVQAAAIRVLTRHGVEVVMPQGQGCCGGLEHHAGRKDAALARVRANVDAWQSEIDRAGLDAIVITASGCGTTVKDYGHMLRTDAAYSARAARISKLTLDISEYLTRLRIVQQRSPGLTVAYHAACSMQHGQKVVRPPKELLSNLGFVVKDIPESHLCCGSAGTYNVLQPELSDRLRKRKVANVEKVRPDVIAAGNIGCITQIAAGTSIPVLHTVELIDWATGGPEPVGLKGKRLPAVPGETVAAVI